MKTCLQCGANLTDEATTCTACGEPQPTYEPYVPPTYAPSQAERTDLQEEKTGKPVSVMRWLCRMLLLWIPLVGGLVYFIMLFVWAFGKKYDATSRSWAKAQLLFLAVDVVLSVVVTMLLYLFAIFVLPTIGVAFTANLAEIFAPGLPLDRIFAGIPEMLSTIFGF